MDISKLSFFNRIRLIALSLCIGPIVLISSYAVISSTNTLKSVLADELKAKSSLVGMEIDKYFLQRQRDIAVVSQSDALESDDNVQKSQYLQEVLEANPEVTDYLVLNKAKEFVASGNSSRHGSNWGNKPSELGGIIDQSYSGKQGEVFLTDAVKSFDGLSVFLVTPITGDDNIEVVGALVAEVSLKQVSKIVADFDDSVIGDKSVYIVNNDGNVVLTADDSYGILDRFKDLDAYPEILQTINTDGSVGSEEYVDFFGDDVIAGLADMDEHGVNNALDWGIVAISEVEAIAAPAFVLGRNIGIMSVTVAVLGAMLLGFNLRSFRVKINEKLLQASDIANDSRKNAKSLQANSTKVSSVVTEQASSIQETVATLNEITSMVNTSVSNAEDSAKRAGLSHQIAEEGKKSVIEMRASMEDIQNTITTMAKKIEDDNQSLLKIVKVVDDISQKTNVINDIVFQTKLLSFNASVEAARAGNNGKGFAVVAEEVGNLAHLSGNSSKEISALIVSSKQEVDSIIAQAKHNSDQLSIVTNEKLEKGTGLAERCEEILSEVVEHVGGVNEHMTSIQSAAQEQAEGVHNINIAMNEIDQATHTSSDIAHMTSNSADELLVVSNKLDRSMEQLGTMMFGNKSHHHIEDESEADVTVSQTIKTAKPSSSPVPSSDDMNFAEEDEDEDVFDKAS